MKITMNNGITFEGTQAEYEEFLAYAERKIAEDEAKEAQAIETIEFEGATYRKVDREAREGDVVVLTGDDLPRWFTKGKAYEIIAGPHIGKCDEGYKNYAVYDSGYGRTRETVDVYEAIEQAKYVPQEGDIVVVTANTSSHANSIGDIGKVGKEEPLDDGGVNVYVPGGPSRAIRTKPCDIRKATPAEVEKYEQAVHKASFAVGDYVKVVKSHCDNEGAILRITGVGNYRTLIGSCEFKVRALTGKTFGKESGVSVDQIVKATPEEAKWAKIGRKPNEFKKGDVVRVKKDGLGVKAGEVHEVYKHDRFGLGGGNVYFDKAEGRVAVSEKLELLAPVESLFNA